MTVFLCGVYFIKNCTEYGGEQNRGSRVSERTIRIRKGKKNLYCKFCLKNDYERAIEMQNNIFMCFIDYQKAFDTVKHE